MISLGHTTSLVDRVSDLLGRYHSVSVSGQGDQVISLGRTTPLVDRVSDLLGPYHPISGQGE